MKIILISGKARSGKDTFGKALQLEFEKHGKRVLNIHYADFLKFFCKEYLGWDGRKDVQGRQILQRIGTDVVRNNYADAWVDIMIALLRGMNTEYDYVLIPDTRFPNEIDSVKAANKEYKFADEVWALRVERPGFDNDLTVEQKAHPSETALDDYEFGHYYLNTKTFEELQLDAADWVKAILEEE